MANAPATKSTKPALERLAAVGLGVVVLGLLDEPMGADVAAHAKKAEQVGEAVMTGAALVCVLAACSKAGGAFETIGVNRAPGGDYHITVWPKDERGIPTGPVVKFTCTMSWVQVVVHKVEA